MLRRLSKKILNSKQFIDRIVDTICKSVVKQFEEKIKMLDEKGDQLSQEVAVGYVEAVLQAELDMPLVWVLQKNNNKGTSC